MILKKHFLDEKLMDDKVVRDIMTWKRNKSTKIKIKINKRRKKERKRKREKERERGAYEIYTE